MDPGLDGFGNQSDPSMNRRAVIVLSLRNTDQVLGDMLTKNHRMQEVFTLVPDIAGSGAAVLIEGETGTGKELLARAIHNEGQPL